MTTPGVARRKFLLGGAALGAGALALTRCTGAGAPAAGGGAAARAAAGTGAGSLARWTEVRALFPLRPDRVHMAGFLLASHPRPVAEAIERHRRGLDEDPEDYLHGNEARLESGVRRAAARYLGAHPDEVALTDSTTMGLGILFGGLRLRAGQELLTTTHDHIVTHEALRYRSERDGAPLRKVALYDEPARASADEITGRLARAITPATRIIAVTWVHSGTGVKLPIRQMAEVVARANAGRAEADRALLVVDGVHGFGNQAVRVVDLGCDAFIAGCHKWIFGPRGTGLIWARPHAWAATGPTIPSFDPSWRTEPLDQLPAASWMTPGGFHSFEHRWALAQAFELHEKIGPARVAHRIAELNTRCKEGLAALPRVKVATPASTALSAGIICFEVKGHTPAQVVAALKRVGVVATVTPDFYEPAYARLAPSLLTLEQDVDRAVAAVAAL